MILRFFIKYSNEQDNYIAKKDCKRLFTYNYMIAVIISTTKRSQIATDFFYWRQKTKHVNVFHYTTSYCNTKDIRLNSTHHFVIKIPSNEVFINS